MPNVVDFYLKNMYKKFKYHAIWLPSREVKVGQIGIFEGNSFTAHSSLDDFGIPFVAEKNISDHDFEYKSSKSINVSSKVEGSSGENLSALSLSDAGIIVDFGSSSGVLFKAIGVTIHEIKNLPQINEKILELEKQGRWNDKYVIINEVIETDSATIIISDSTKSKIELKATGSVSGSALNIADSKLGLQVLFEAGINTKIIAKSGMSPLFKAVGLSRGFLNSRKAGDENIEREMESMLQEVPYLDDSSSI